MKFESKRTGFSIFLLAIMFVISCGETEMKSGVKVGEKIFSHEYLNEYIRQSGAQNSPTKIKNKIVNELINKELLSQLSKNEWLENNLELKVKIESLERELCEGAYVKKRIQAISERELRRRYKENISEYSEKTAKLAMIVIRNDSKNDSNTRMRTAYSRLKNGEDFGVIAKEYSDDVYSKNRNGLLGEVNYDKIDKEYSELVFDLKKGELSKIIENSSGIYLFKMLDGPFVKAKSFEDVKSNIELKLKAKKKEELLEKLKIKTEVVNNYMN